MYLQFPETGDIVLQLLGSDLKLTILDTQDTVTVKDWLHHDTPRYGIEHIAFADGTTWDTDAIKQMVLEGTAGDDVLDRGWGEGALRWQRAA